MQNALHKVQLRYCAVMKRLGSGCLLLAGMFFFEVSGWAQNSLDMLEKDLNQIDQQHQDASSKNLDTFLSTLATASASPDAVIKLYEDAGGTMPDAAKVKAQYDSETPTERSARVALDQAMLAEFSGTLQLHCGMMRLAALFVDRPQSTTLHDEWIAWLKSAAQLYPQVAVALVDTRRNPENKIPNRNRRGDTDKPDLLDPNMDRDGNSTSHHDDQASAEPVTPPPPQKIDVAADIRSMTMNDSIISSYLGFQDWGQSKQGQWSVSDLPKLYKENVLDPLRQPPTAAALPAWDTYIAMKAAEQSDQDKWTHMDLPALQFERDTDDFASSPSTDKLETLVGIIKANPDHPKVGVWISRVHDMMQAFRDHKPWTPPVNPSDAPAATTPATTATPAPAVPAPASAPAQ
jgi:hypothetical protein